MYIDGLGCFAAGGTNSNAQHGIPSSEATNEKERVVWESTGLNGLDAMVRRAIESRKKDGSSEGDGDGKVMLLVDGLDFLLAASTITAEQLLSILHGWREVS